MNDDAKKNPTPYDVSDALFAGMVDKAKQYDEIVANLVAGHKIRPNETGDFQAVLSVVANMASAKVATFDPAWLPVQEAAERVINNRQRPQFFGILEALNQKPNEIVLRFEELVSNLHKIGVIDQPFPKPDEVVRIVLAPFLAGWKANDYTMSVTPLSDPYAGIFGIQRKEQDDAIRDAKNGDFTKLAKLVGRPELVAPMKHIIAARKTLANGRVLGGEPLQSMCDAAVKDVDSLARITDTLQHYGQLRSASTVQSVKDLCNEYESIWGKLTKERFLPGDRVSTIVAKLLEDVDAQPRDAADAQEIAKFLSDVYPTKNHSLPNAVRALFENYRRAESLAEELKSFLNSEEVYFEKGKLLDGLRNYVDLLKFFKKEDEFSGRLESTDEPMFLEMLRGELFNNRSKKPKANNIVGCLEGAVAVAKNAATSKSLGEVIQSAVEVAAWAWRLAEEGDRSWNDARKAKGLSKFKKWKGDVVIQSFKMSVPIVLRNRESEEDFAARVAINEGTTSQIVDGMMNNPNHPENALFRIGKALVDAGQLDPEEMLVFSECAFAVEILLKNKKTGDALLKKVADKLAESGWLALPEIFDERSLLAALDAVIQNRRTDVGDAQLKVRQQEREAAKALVDLSYILNPDGLLSIPELLNKVRDLTINRSNQADALVAINDIVSADKKLNIQDIVRTVGSFMTQGQQDATALQAIADILFEGRTRGDQSFETIDQVTNEVKRLVKRSTIHSGHLTMLTALETIREIVMTAEGNHDQHNTTDAIVSAVKRHFDKMKEGVYNWHILGELLYSSNALDKNAPLSFVNVRTAIGNLIEKQFKTMGLANQLKDDVEDLSRKLSAQVDERGNVEDERDELRVRLKKAEEQVANLIHHGPQHLFFLLSDAGVMDTYNDNDFPSLEEGINRLIAARKEASGDLKSVFEELNKRNDEIAELTKRNDAQKYCIETIGGTVGNNDGTLPSIWSAVRDLAEYHEKALAHIGEVRNLIFGTFPDRPLLDYPSIVATLQDLIHIRMFAREAEIVLGEMGPKYVGTLVERARHAVRVVNATTRANIEGIKRLAAAVAKVNGVDLGDPSSFESIEAAILNLGWDRDRHVAALRQQYIALPRAFADGQRVFVHYFDGCSDEYLGQKAAEIRGAKYVSGQFGWFYMVEFEDLGLGGMKFDYAETRLALVAEAYLLAGDRVRVHNTQDEGTIVEFFPAEQEYLVDQSGLAADLMGRARFAANMLVPVEQAWSIFDRKGGKNRLLVIHAPDKWEAERRAAQRLSKAGKPYVTPALIAIPGVADNAHYGGVTTDVEVKVNRVSGRDINLLWSIRFPGNDVDAANVREAIGTLISTDRTSSGERIDKMLPRLRGLKNHFDKAPDYKEGDAVEFVQEGGEPISGNVVRLISHDFGDRRWSYAINCGHIIGEVEKFEDDLKPSWDADDQAAKAKGRKFNEGQLVSYIETKETGRQVAFIQSDEIDPGTGSFMYTLRTLAQGSTLAGEIRLRYEQDLEPESKFKDGQRVIAKRRNSDGDNFAKILSATYSDWAKKWKYDIEITAHSLKTSRWEEDLEAVPNIGVPVAESEVLIQQAVTNIVDREEELQTARVARRPKPQFKEGDRVLVQPSGRRDVITGDPAFSSYKNAWAYPVEGEREHILEGYLRPDMRPEPLFKKGDEVNVGWNTMSWFVRDFDWSTRGLGWLYSMTANPDGAGSGQGGVKEAELKSASQAILSRFLDASAALQANADKMVGSVVSVPTDAVERAKKDGAINPDFLAWVRDLLNRNFIVKATKTNNMGEVALKIDDSIFHYPVKYLAPNV